MKHLSRDQIIHLAGGETLTARAQSAPGRHAWVGVVSLEKSKVLYLNSAEEGELGRLRVIYFEVEQRVIWMDYDVHQEEMLNTVIVELPGCEELSGLLSRYGVEVSDLTFKNETGYPI
jgi:hypothetical protein